MKAFASFIAFLFENLAKLIWFLLKALSLWIPAVFSVAFLIVCAATGTALSEAMLFFVFGLILTGIAAVALTVMRLVRKHNMRVPKKSAEVRPGTSGYKPKRNKEANYYVAGYTDGDGMPEDDGVAYYARYNRKAEPEQPAYGEREPEANSNVYTYPPAQPKAYEQPPQQPSGYGQPQQPKHNMYDNLYEQPKQAAEARKPVDQAQQSMFQEPPEEDFNEAGYKVEGYNGKYGPLSETDGQQPNGERGLVRVFKTRMDPNMLIYEYEDKLMFYKNTSRGLIHLSTERKNINK